MGVPLLYRVYQAPLTSCVCMLLAAVHFLVSSSSGGGANTSSSSSASSSAAFMTLPDLGLNLHRVLAHKQYYRLLTSSLVHASLAHLVMNICALWSLGSSLEITLGPVKYATLLVQFSVLPSILLLVVLAMQQAGQRALALRRSGTTDLLPLFHSVTAATEERDTSMTVGFSGALFAMAVQLVHAGDISLLPSHGREIPILSDPRTHPWVLLFASKALVPTSSFAGHLCGMAVGYASVGGAIAWLDVYWTMTLFLWLVGACAMQWGRTTGRVIVVTESPSTDAMEQPP
ncbi:rhomboid domain-containing protein [Pycnococcus provasolii]